MVDVYPPDRHLLRDLRLSFLHGEGESRAWLPVVPELCAGDGAVRAGALAVLVDVIGGGLAAAAARPDWIATADLTLHLVRSARDGRVEARARVLRKGRTTVVIEVELRDERDDEVGAATMSFSVLPRRATNPVVADTIQIEPSTMALPDSRLDVPFLDRLGFHEIDAAAGVLEAPVADWSRNSLGAMQGGAVATLVDAAAEAALAPACGRPIVVRELQITYLALCRTGPIRTRASVLGAGPTRGTAHVELVDTGAGGRVTTVARVVALPWEHT
jgi:uncharacterized protein (TIGR00369 family)